MVSIKYWHVIVIIILIAISIRMGAQVSAVVPSMPAPLFPKGAIIIVITGFCPTGFSEVPSLNGLSLLGTIAVNGNIGTIGGSDNVVPTGNISTPIFNGNSLASHSHELPFQLNTTNPQYRQIGSGIFGTGTSRLASSQGTFSASSVNAPVAMSQSVSAGVPSGIISTPLFSGGSFDNRSRFMRVIFCSKN